ERAGAAPSATFRAGGAARPRGPGEPIPGEAAGAAGGGGGGGGGGGAGPAAVPPPASTTARTTTSASTAGASASRGRGDEMDRTRRGRDRACHAVLRECGHLHHQRLAEGAGERLRGCGRDRLDARAAAIARDDHVVARDRTGCSVPGEVHAGARDIDRTGRRGKRSGSHREHERSAEPKHPHWIPPKQRVDFWGLVRLAERSNG